MKRCLSLEDVPCIKKPRSVWVCFLTSKKRDNVSFIDLSAQMSSTWKTMSAEEKQPFFNMAENDRKRYEEECALLTPEDRAKMKKRQQQLRPRRHLNGFLLFLREKREGKENKEQDQTILCQEASKEWQAFSEEEKETYNQQAKQQSCELAKKRKKQLHIWYFNVSRKEFYEQAPLMCERKQLEKSLREKTVNVRNLCLHGWGWEPSDVIVLVFWLAEHMKLPEAFVLDEPTFKVDVKYSHEIRALILHRQRQRFEFNTQVFRSVQVSKSGASLVSSHEIDPSAESPIFSRSELNDTMKEESPEESQEKDIQKTKTKIYYDMFRENPENPLLTEQPAWWRVLCQYDIQTYQDFLFVCKHDVAIQNFGLLEKISKQIQTKSQKVHKSDANTIFHLVSELLLLLNIPSLVAFGTTVPFDDFLKYQERLHQICFELAQASGRTNRSTRQTQNSTFWTVKRELQRTCGTTFVRSSPTLLLYEPWSKIQRFWTST